MFTFGLGVEKCGFDKPYLDIGRNLTNCTNANMQKIILSPNGHCYIHFDTTGADAPDLEDLDMDGIPDYINNVATTADSSYALLVETMNFNDGANGIDNITDIYVVELSGSAYGWTRKMDDSCVDTCVEIDNNYDESNYYTHGLTAMQVTLIHEYFHTIQLGYQCSTGSDSYFYELTSTWIEDVGFPDSNDYLNFMTQSSSSSNYYKNPELDFDDTNGYSTAWFGHFLSTQYEDIGGITHVEELESVIMRKIWGRIAVSGSSALNIVDYILENDYNSTFIEAWSEFNSRNLFNQIDESFYYYQDQSEIGPIEIEIYELETEMSTMLVLNNKSVKIVGYLNQFPTSVEFYPIISSEFVQGRIVEISGDNTENSIFVFNQELNSVQPGEIIYFLLNSELFETELFEIVTNMNETYYGCIDIEACNYDNNVYFDDGSCLYFDCFDECGGYAEFDCANVCGGNSILDCYGTCDDIPDNDLVLDACENCGGDCVMDEFGFVTCGESNLNVIFADCFGVCIGSAEFDCLGICNGINEYDCTNVCGGNAFENNCGCVSGDTENLPLYISPLPSDLVSIPYSNHVDLNWDSSFDKCDSLWYNIYRDNEFLSSIGELFLSQDTVYLVENSIDYCDDIFDICLYKDEDNLIYYSKYEINNFQFGLENCSLDSSQIIDGLVQSNGFIISIYNSLLIGKTTGENIPAGYDTLFVFEESFQTDCLVPLYFTGIPNMFSDYSVIPEESYKYSISVENEFGETEKIDSYIITTWPSPENIKQTEILSVYPNPIEINYNSEFTIIIDSNIELNSGTFRLYDLLGREINIWRNVTLEKGRQRISFDGLSKYPLSSGVYFISFQKTSNKISSIPVMVIR